MKNKTTRILISLGIGIILAMIIMSIKIYFGYTYAYKFGVDGYMVKVFGIDIYALIRNGDIYSGTAIGKSMGLLCAIFIVCAIMIEKLRAKICNN